MGSGGRVQPSGGKLAAKGSPFLVGSARRRNAKPHWSELPPTRASVREREILVASCPPTFTMPPRSLLSGTPSKCRPRVRARHAWSLCVSLPSLVGVAGLQKSLLWPCWRFSASAQLLGSRSCVVFVLYRSAACSRGALCVARALVSRESTASAGFERRSEGLFALCLYQKEKTL